MSESWGGAGGWGNPVVGSTALRIPAINSPNFVHGVSGWSINKDGSAEFNSVTLPAGAGGATVFVQGTAPVANHVNDVWVNTASGNEIETWNGSAWVPQQFGTGAIQASSITSGLIAANAVVAGLVAAGAIDGQVINGVTINGATINATSGGVFVYNTAGGTVLNANPNFATGITSWTAVAGGISYTTPVISGHDTMQLALTNPASMGLAYNGIVQSEFEAVTAGSNYLVTYQVQLSGVTSGATLAVDWYTSGSAFISQSVIATPSGTSAVWTTYSGVVTAPAGATQMKLTITAVDGSVSTAFVNVGQAQIATQPSLVNAIAPAAGTDPYGDAYQLGVGSYGPSGGYALLASNGSFPALVMNPESVTHLTVQPQIYGSAANAGAVNEYNTLILSSGKNGHDDAALQLFAESADATVAAVAVIEFGGQAVVFVTRNGMAANQPGTSNTPESWHTMTLLNGWTVGSGGFAQYKLMPDRTVMIRLNNVTPGTIADGTSIWTAPTGYVPTTQHKLALVATYSAAPVYGSMPFLYTNGSALEVFNLRGTVSGIHTTERYALD